MKSHRWLGGVFGALLLMGCQGTFNPDLSAMSATEGETSDTEDGTGSTGDENSTGEETDTGMMDMGTEMPDMGTEDPEPLQLGEICHPITLDPPCDDGLVCVYAGWDGSVYQWECKTFTGSPGKGFYGDPCSQTTTHSDCQDGYECRAGVFPDGDCEGTYCCDNNCNPLEPTCDGIDQICVPYSEDEGKFPAEYGATESPTIGVCDTP